MNQLSSVCFTEFAFKKGVMERLKAFLGGHCDFGGDVRM